MLNRIPIRHREVAILIVLIIGFIIVGIFVYDSLRSIEASSERVTSLTECEVRLGQIRASMDTLLIQLEQIADESGSAQDIDAGAGLTVEKIALLFAEIQESDLDFRELDVAQTRFLQLSAAIDSMMVQAEEGQPESVANLASQSIDDVRNLSGSVQVIQGRVQEEIVGEVSVTNDRVTVAIVRTLLSLLALALVSTLGLVRNARSITSGISVLTAGARDLAASDTSGPPISFPAGRSDEFTQLGEVFNQMAMSIRTQRVANYNQMKELQTARAVAESATERKSDYLANMSHELRAPMHIIMNFTRVMMEGEGGEVSPEQAKYLQRVMDSSKHLLHVINDVLDTARIEAGQLEIVASDLQLDDLLDEMILSGRALIEQSGKDLSFSIDSPPDLPTVFADEKRVRQILLNLIGNAVRFTDEGSIKLSFGIGADALTICVEDSGQGISPKKLAVIFERFEHAGVQEEERRGGTGLGLSIARDLTRLQGGRIWATSTVGEGSIFCFTLPRSKRRD